MRSRPEAEPKGPLGERNFRRVFLAQAFSTIGDNIAPIALAFAVLDLTDSTSSLGLVLAARTLPLLILVLAGGVWADRLSRHRLMVAADLIRLTTQAGVAALLLSGSAQVWELVVLQALNGAGTAFFRPAAAGLTPQTLSPANVRQGIALLGLSDSSASFIGPVVAGLLVASAGPGWTIALDAATFGISAIFLSNIRIEGHPQQIRSFRAELREGWDEVRTRDWLWVMLLVFAAFQVFVLASWQVLGPAIARDHLGGAGAWAAVTACWGAGAVLGGVVAFRLHPRRPLLVCNLTICLVAPAMILLGAAVPTLLIAVAAVPAGLAFSLADVLWETTLQQHIPADSLSRVSAYDWLGSTALRPLGYALVGSIGAAIGIGKTMIISAALMLISQMLALARSSIRTTEGRPSPAHRPSPARQPPA